MFAFKNNPTKKIRTLIFRLESAMNTLKNATMFLATRKFRGLILILLAMGAVLAAAASPAAAQQSRTISYQGFLADSLGNPITDTTLEMVFRILSDSDGVELWSETHPEVSFNDGGFSVLLGSINGIPDSAFTQYEPWLQVGISTGKATLVFVPAPIGAVPFAVVMLGSTINGDLHVTGKATIGPNHVNNGDWAFVAGNNNVAYGDFATVFGNLNGVVDNGGTVSGGVQNQAGYNDGIVDNQTNATVGGGTFNYATATNATVGGGSSNSATAANAIVGGGTSNSATASIATVGGGSGNQASGLASTIAGGWDNTADNSKAAIGGGIENHASGEASTIAGGTSNSASGNQSAIIGGQSNVASGEWTTIGGGYFNKARGNFSAVCGGGGTSMADSNRAGASYSFVGGGRQNIANGSYSIVPGGYQNQALGSYSFSAGRHAIAEHHGTFVWADNSTSNEFRSTNNNQFLIRATGGVGINTDDPAAALHVSGTVRMDGFTMPTNAVDGYVLTTNSSGVGTWQPGGGGGGGNTLDQAYDQGGPGAGRVIIADNGYVDIDGPDGFRVEGNVAIGNLSAPVSTVPLYVRQDVNSSSGQYGTYIDFENTGTGSAYGMQCRANSDGPGRAGVQGFGYATTPTLTTGTSYGVMGTAQRGENAYGIYGTASGATNNYAGYFNGNVNVTGILSKGGGAFKIDHPLDPANKYLFHSFVESPDMMNIYNGNVITDDKGFATVTLPDYFSSLNKDFRYQLTVMGQFAQAIIASEIETDRFVIQTDKPNVKVSWQVTGIRQDPYAEANRIQVEVDKSGSEQGKYLHPEVYGLSEEMGVDYEHKQYLSIDSAEGSER
jgi:hypothetical protein